MYENIFYRNDILKMREVARQENRQCRLLMTKDGQLFLEYLVSTGPYKIDVPTVIELQPEMLQAYQAGNLDLATLIPSNEH